MITAATGNLSLKCALHGTAVAHAGQLVSNGELLNLSFEAAILLSK
jgi:hypothetical protein